MGGFENEIRLNMNLIVLKLVEGVWVFSMSLYFVYMALTFRRFLT